MKKRLGLIGMVILLTGVVLAALEYMVRNYQPQVTADKINELTFNCFTEDDNRWIKLAANKTCMLGSAFNAFAPVEIKTNSLGLRNAEVSLDKPNNTKRILFVGDSFTMGWGVKETEAYPRVTESILRTKNLAFNVETINAGFTAGGPSGYYLYLKNEGWELKPDIVVVGFYLGNDITSRTDVVWEKVDEEGLPEVIRSKTAYVDYLGRIRFKDGTIKYDIPILRNSHLFMYLWNKYAPREPGKVIVDETLVQLYCLFTPDCNEMDKAKDEVKMLFRAMKKLAVEKGAELVVMMIPAEFQVNFSATNRIKYGFPINPSGRSSLNDEFREYFENEGIKVIDALPTLLNHNERTYMQRDDHWNAEGHAVAAQIVAEKLEEMLTKTEIN